VTGAAIPIEPRTTRRIAIRLLPFLFILYIVAFLDRVNVSYAALEMSRALAFSDRVFGLGAGIFFVGYVLFEIPGAIIVERWSARRWIARILVTWGLVSMLLAAVRTANQFYAVRLLLGAAEAGFFPGVIVYLTHWFRYRDRARAIALFMAAIPLANIIGSPVAGWLLSVRWLGVQGWQWLFILEGIPACVLGVVTLWYLTDWPREAAWLGAEEQAWIDAELRREKEAKAAVLRCTVWQALRRTDVLLLTLAYFLGEAALYGFTFWFPTMLKRASGLTNARVGLLAALPYVAGLAAMLWNGWHSDRSGERRWHTAVPLLVGGLFLGVAIAAASRPMIGFVAMVIVGACTSAFLPTFWALPTQLLSESAAAASIGFINSFGNLGGFAGPYAVGYLQSATNSFAPGLMLLAGCFVGSAIVIVISRPSTPAWRSETPDWRPAVDGTSARVH
jgi:MFS transporter, ACS family, tartrate transporter